MTHAELVKVAVRWLRKTHRCGVVLAEHHGGTLEVPDAIGWRGGFHSIQVECKVSCSDFRADAKKAGRLQAGDYRQAAERWYLTPLGLIDASRIPYGWGSAQWDGRRVLVMKQPELAERSPDTWRNEVTRLYMELRRYQAQGIRYKTVAELLAEPSAAPTTGCAVAIYPRR